MDEKAEELAASLVKRLQSTPPQSRLLIGISGIAASGKSTFSSILLAKTNNLLLAEGNSKDSAILVGQDGWHYTRAQLDAFPDPKLAHARRGVHWSFDAEAWVDFVKRLRVPLNLHSTPSSTPAGPETVISAPTFSHSVKDPVPNSLHIHSFHRIVIFEGLYTTLSIDPWVDATACLDELWWIECEEDVSIRRLTWRHVDTGIVNEAKAAEERAVNNDIPNARFIQHNMKEPTMRITLPDDPFFDVTDAEKGKNEVSDE